MTDKELIKALRDYAKSYVNDMSYGLNPGIALMAANRMEELIGEQVEFELGDRVWIPDCVYDEWFIANEDGYIIDGIKIYTNSEGNELKMYMLQNGNEFQECPPKLCFGSYEECEEWCNKQNGF